MKFTFTAIGILGIETHLDAPGKTTVIQYPVYLVVLVFCYIKNCLILSPQYLVLRYMG